MRQIAEYTGASPESVRRYFRDGRPSLEFLNAFVTTNKVNAHWLLTGVEPRTLENQAGPVIPSSQLSLPYEPSYLARRLNEIGAGQSVRLIADHTGVSSESARRYLRDGRASLEFLIAFATTYNVNIHWLLTGEGPRTFMSGLKSPVPAWLASPVSLYFDTDEFSPEQIANLIAMFSKLYQDIGGDKLIIDSTSILEHALVGVPT